MIIRSCDYEFISNNIDYIDFGCKLGSSFELCEKILGGRKGLGLDINIDYVNQYRDSEFNAMLCDITDVDLPDGIVDFVCASHVLEHLPTEKDVFLAVKECIRLSKKFAYIVGPYFDADDFLRENGLKFFWSDWTWHPTHVTSNMLENSILNSGQICSFQVWGRLPIYNSDSNDILCLTEPSNQHHHDPKLHASKDFRVFEKVIFKEIAVLIIKDKSIDYNKLISDLKLSHLILSGSTCE
jgi:hypothetical protein